MGAIREAAKERTMVLEPDYTVGRSVRCGLCIPDRRVSSQHALFRWTGTVWEVKDLASRNGTFVNGQRLNRGDGTAVRKGTTVAFGVLDDHWEIADDSPPYPMIVPLDGGPAVRLDNGIAAVPSADDPQVTIYQVADGTWLVEREGGPSLVAVSNQQTLDIGDRRWRFSAPEHVWQTSVAGGVNWDISTSSIRVAVSRDEEQVQVTLLSGNETIELGTRGRHYLLLTLARRRLADAARKLPEVECGWIDHEELAHDPSMSGAQLNVDIFRIRQHVASLKIAGAARIIERRPRAKQLRIGTGKLEIVRW